MQTNNLKQKSIVLKCALIEEWEMINVNLIIVAS